MTKTLILHNGGLASAVAAGLACKIHKPEEVIILTFGRFDNQQVKSAATLAEHLKVGRFILGHIGSNAPLSILVDKAANVAVGREIPEMVVGIYNRNAEYEAIKRFQELHHLIDKRWSPGPPLATLRAPLLHLEKVDLVKKAVDLELPLDMIRDCEAEREKFCGVCPSCRMRIDAFRRAKMMDYDYEVEIDFDLPPIDQREYEEWRGDAYGF